MPTIILISLLAICGIFIAIFYLKLKQEAHDLYERNKRLFTLRKLDEIMMSSATDLKDVAQKVTDAIAFELGFQNGVLALINEKEGVLQRVAMSNTPYGIRAKQALPFSYEDLKIPLAATENIAIQAINSGQMTTTHDLYDVFVPALDKDFSKKLQQTVGVTTAIVYPIRARGKVIGVMIVSLDKDTSQLFSYEKESIEELFDVVGLALDTARLYQQLQMTSKSLKDANLRLQQLDKLKDDFVSVASHELRTPMTAIRSYAWMALHKSDVPLSDKLEKYLIRVFLSSERLIKLVNDMLNISRIESGRIEISPESVNLISLCKDIIDEVYYSKSTEKNVQFVMMEQNLPQVFADPEKLREVLLNLVGNAIKFTPLGKKITFSFFTDGQVVETKVKDEGVGIAKDDLSRLFQKFSKLDSSYSMVASSGGTGLGLYISKSLVELMHGKIWAASDGLGKGSTFTVSLPVATAEVIAHTQEYSVKPKEGMEAKPLEPVAL